MDVAECNGVLGERMDSRYLYRDFTAWSLTPQQPMSLFLTSPAGEGAGTVGTAVPGGAVCQPVAVNRADI